MDATTSFSKLIIHWIIKESAYICYLSHGLFNLLIWVLVLWASFTLVWINHKLKSAIRNLLYSLMDDSLLSLLHGEQHLLMIDLYMLLIHNLEIFVVKHCHCDEFYLAHWSKLNKSASIVVIGKAVTFHFTFLALIVF